MTLKTKLSAGTSLLLSRLQAEVNAEEIAAMAVSDISLDMNKDKLATLLEGYTTTVSGVENLTVTVQDVEKVANFRHDYQQALRVHGANIGATYMEDNAEAESFRITLNTELAGNKELSVQTAFFRPGKEDQGNCNFVSITDTWEADDEDKAVDAHLKSLTKRLVK